MVKGRIAVHSTHEAADRLGGIGAVLGGLLGEKVYHEFYEKSLLVGVYNFPDDGSVIDDVELRTSRGWHVTFDSQVAEHAETNGGDGRLNRALGEVAERFGVRLVYGHRRVAPEVQVPCLLASPQGLKRDLLDYYRRQVAEQQGVDLAAFDRYPALTDRVDRQLARLLDPAGAARHGDQPERVIVDGSGRPFPGGAGWAEGRAVFPKLTALDAFYGFAASNKYLLELQYHTFAAPALWAATRAVLAHWAPLARRGYDPARVTLFAHDWLGVPLFWALRAAGETVAQTVYMAHEARIFRLLAEGVLRDRAALLRAVCSPDGFDASLYPYLALALERGWDLWTMFPGCDGFADVFHHQINREARKFDRVVAVGPLVRDEMQVLLRPEAAEQTVSLCPNGIPSKARSLDAVWAARERLTAVAERYCGFRPDVLVTAVMRCEISKAPWRNVTFVKRLAERMSARGLGKLAFFWLSAPKPRPTRAQADRWRSAYGWPLDHRSAPDGDLRSDELGLWHTIAGFNEGYAGRARMFYINQFGWGSGLLGAIDPGDCTFDDLRSGADVELGLSIYEPFGIAPLEPYASGAVCVLSDACGCARHLRTLELDDTVLIGRFTEHGEDPRTIDDARRRKIEAKVYDQIIDQLVERLGLTGGDPKALRGARLERAQAAVKKLSWEAALKEHLLKALV